MPSLELKATQEPVAEYYNCLTKFDKLGIKYEGAVRSAFQELLDHCGWQFELKLLAE